MRGLSRAYCAYTTARRTCPAKKTWTIVAVVLLLLVMLATPESAGAEGLSTGLADGVAETVEMVSDTDMLSLADSGNEASSVYSGEAEELPPVPESPIEGTASASGGAGEVFDDESQNVRVVEDTELVDMWDTEEPVLMQASDSRDYTFEGGLVTVTGVTSGEPLFYWDGNACLILSDVTADTVTVNGRVTVMLEGSNHCGICNAGSDLLLVTGTGSIDDSIWSDDGPITIEGGTIDAAVTSYGTGRITVAGGMIRASDAGRYYSVGVGGTSCDVVVSGGTIDLTGYCVQARNIELSGGKISIHGNVAVGISAGGTVVVSKGSLTVEGVLPNCVGVSAHGDITVSGGTVKVSSTSKGAYGLYAGEGSEGFEVLAAGNVRISGGSVSIKGFYGGVDAEAGIITISGGTVNVNACDRGLIAYAGTVGGKWRGGKVSITGGAISVVVSKPSSNYAIFAGNAERKGTMSNKAACLKKISGKLPVGACFKVAGNEYAIRTEDEATLTRYGSSKKSVTLNKVSFGGSTFEVRGIGANAFNTKQGRKLTSIVCKLRLKAIGKNAFTNTTSLAKLTLCLNLEPVWKKDKPRSLKAYYTGGCSVNKTAFKKCGKAGGKKLTVRMNGSTYASALYVKYLRGHGLPKAAKVNVDWFKGLEM